MFPSSEQELIEGDPNAIYEKQRQDHVNKQMAKLKAGSKRKIDFGPPRYVDKFEEYDPSRETADFATGPQARYQFQKEPRFVDYYEDYDPEYEASLTQGRAASSVSKGKKRATQSNGGSQSKSPSSTAGRQSSTAKSTSHTHTRRH